ncbi:MAG: hypothetical protein A2622_13480 [Bdellovibrionales bacterium RIFCSPHIGHO2_01_FULL_40_29]|nr:MAG: hypothetical protein A2622_13480 [Bdellovibrionales bacterium RIFCSPHIGHO2_01_FULL_40_29]OFZ34292.1 MAG: hypothetical protein A3D17_04470 [Bdellovibrionales bacterium RIFCSPHIGHO2_02_FULL_40_15]
MQLEKISLVGADFEIGQAKKGMIESSNILFKFLKKNYLFDFEIIKQVKSSIRTEPIHCFSDADLFRMDVAKYEELCHATTQGIYQNNRCLNFGGDHSIAISTIEASLRKNQKTHVLWIDAHADANCIGESLTGNFHGMPAYYLMSESSRRPLLLQWMQKTLKPEQMTYIGLRDLDPFEKVLLKKANITVFTADQITTEGMEHVLKYLRKKNDRYEKIHLSFDIDSMDPSYGICTGVPVSGGLRLKDVEQIFNLVSESGKLMNVDFVEVNPSLAASASELNHVYSLVLHLLEILFKLKPTFTAKESACAHTYY